MRTHRNTVSHPQHLISLNAFLKLFFLSRNARTLQDCAFQLKIIIIIIKLLQNPAPFLDGIFVSFIREKNNIYLGGYSQVSAVILSQNVTVNK